MADTFGVFEPQTVGESGERAPDQRNGQLFNTGNRKSALTNRGTLDLMTELGPTNGHHEWTPADLLDAKEGNPARGVNAYGVMN